MQNEQYFTLKKIVLKKTMSKQFDIFIVMFKNNRNLLCLHELGTTKLMTIIINK